MTDTNGTSRLKKQCRRCRGWWDEEAFFRVNRALHASSARRRHAVCIGCEEKARTAEKQADRWLPKARDTIRRHALRLKMTVAQLRSYGWTVERIAHDLRHAYENTCGYCWQPYASMGHGTADITVDVVDRRKPPDYRTNTKLCCNTCNREKGTLAPEIWEERLRTWTEYEAHMAKRRTIPVQLSLGVAF